MADRSPSTGLGTGVQDLGRLGHSRYGLPVNGALDQYSARVANVLAGNDEGAPLLEITALDFACTPSPTCSSRSPAPPPTSPSTGPAAAVGAGRLVRAGRDRSASARIRLRAAGLPRRARLGGHPTPAGQLRPGHDPRLRRAAGATAMSSTVAVRTARRSTIRVFDIPLFRLRRPCRTSSSRWTIDVTDGPDLAEFGDDRGRGSFRSPSSRVDAREQPHRAADAPGRPRPLPGRAIGEVLSRGVPVGAVEVPDGRRAAGAAPRPRRHRRLPGARRRHRRPACPASGRPAPAQPSGSATSPAPPRSRTTGASRPTSPSPRPRPDRLHQSRHTHSHFADTAPSQSARRHPLRTSTAPSATELQETAMTTVPPAQPDIPNAPIDPKPPEGRPGRGLRRHLRRALRQRHLRLHGRHPGHRLLP